MRWGGESQTARPMRRLDLDRSALDRAFNKIQYENPSLTKPAFNAVLHVACEDAQMDTQQVNQMINNIGNAPSDYLTEEQTVEQNDSLENLLENLDNSLYQEQVYNVCGNMFGATGVMGLVRAGMGIEGMGLNGKLGEDEKVGRMIIFGLLLFCGMAFKCLQKEPERKAREMASEVWNKLKSDYVLMNIETANNTSSADTAA